MASKRSKTGSSTGSKKKKTSTKSRNSTPGGSGRPPSQAVRAALKDEAIDDITLLNVHRYPESVPSSVVSFVRNDRNCQRRLEDLIKGLPGGKRGQSSFNQLFQQKMDENPAPPPSTRRSGDDDAGEEAGAEVLPNAGGEIQPADYRTGGQQSGGVGGFLRKLFS